MVADVEFMAVTRISDVTAEDAAAAAAACALLDLSLLDASGLEALHALRGLSDRLPIVVLTGFDDLELGLSAIRDGAEDYLIKNYVDSQMLDRAIRYAIERRRLTVELVASASEASAAVAAAEEATDAAKLATEPCSTPGALATDTITRRPPLARTWCLCASTRRVATICWRASPAPGRRTGGTRPWSAGRSARWTRCWCDM